MKIVHLLHEFPFPPTSGVRCDTGRRLRAFSELGHDVFAVSWVSAGKEPGNALLAEMESHAARSAMLPIGAGLASKLRRIANLRSYPSYIASRIPSATELAELEAQIASFDPELIWLEGVHPSWLAWHLSRKFSLPLVYRAHNIEHAYLAEQARLSPTLRQKLALLAGTYRLKEAEEALRRDADAVFDISADDLAWWQERGFAKGLPLLTQADPEIIATAEAPAGERDIDLLFVGGLSSPNNIAAIDWFASDILPLVKTKYPDASVTIAGRAPSPGMVRRLEDLGVDVEPDPPSVVPIFARARVMMNPILHGSGVNIKTIDMIASGQPVVTTTKGVRGLPDAVTKEIHVADDPAGFADALCRALADARDGKVPPGREEMIEDVFGNSSLEMALALVQEARG